jgi:hypothetical protein
MVSKQLFRTAACAIGLGSAKGFQKVSHSTKVVRFQARLTIVDPVLMLQLCSR